MDRLLDDMASALQRDGFVLTFSRALGGHTAAWDAFELNLAAGRDASIRRASDHDPDAWTLEVRPWR